MDPQPLSPSEWAQIGNALKFLWAALGLSVVAGFSLLIAHALITSLVDTNTISARWASLRPLFYFVGIVAVIGLIACLIGATLNMGWIDVSYPRYWQ